MLSVHMLTALEEWLAGGITTTELLERWRREYDPLRQMMGTHPDFPAWDHFFTDFTATDNETQRRQYAEELLATARVGGW